MKKKIGKSQGKREQSGQICIIQWSREDGKQSREDGKQSRKDGKQSRKRWKIGQGRWETVKERWKTVKEFKRVKVQGWEKLREDKKVNGDWKSIQKRQEKSKKIGNWGKKESKESKEDEKRKIETSIGKGE